jgi:CBS domain-containing protein
MGPDPKLDQQRLGEIAVLDIMSSDLIILPPDATLCHAASEMLGNGISCLPVLADEKLVGILTGTDLQAVLEVLLEASQAALAAQPAASLA